MYIAICDDQAEQRKELAALMERWQKERGTTLRYRIFDEADELLRAAQKERFTMYLLDIMMPGTSGLAAAKEIRGFDEEADIVFLTALPDFAYESYSVQALGYLLKPVQTGKLFEIIDKIALREKKPQDGLTLKCGAALVRVPFSQLEYVEVNGKHLYFNLTDGTMREVAGTMKAYEPLLLSRPEFMRVHRSYIVNMFQAEEFSMDGVKTFSGKNIPVSRLLYAQLQKDYMKLMFAQTEEL